MTRSSWWQDRALCRGEDPRIWFPERDNGTKTSTARRRGLAHVYDEARAICDACPVERECLAYAMTLEAKGLNSRSGMFGGKTPEERHRLAGGRVRAHWRMVSIPVEPAWEVVSA